MIKVAKYLDMQKLYITTPIYYVNSQPHIGHAYTDVIADVIARFWRLYGFEVRLTTGTDEHGIKIQKAAIAAGVQPQQFVDEISTKFKDMADSLHISYDDFIRTTEPRHKSFVLEVWQKLQPYIYRGKYGGWYCIRDEAFYTQDEIKDGKSPTGADVEWVEEECYFFRLSSFGDQLLAFYEQHPNFVFPRSRLNEMISFVKSGLQDLCISRKLEWGIKIPEDPSQAIYVWLDALTNYLSSIQGQEEFWKPALNLFPLHIVGKDILRFHAVYWPAFLMAVGFSLPGSIIAHGWWTAKGEKISKSLSNAIDPFELIQEFGVDQTRYFLIRGVVLGNDGDFSKILMKELINSDLANNVGNLIQRVLSMIAKYYNNQVPPPGAGEQNTLLSEAYNVSSLVKEDVESYNLQGAILRIINLSSSANALIARTEPWNLIKEEKMEELGSILYTLLEVIRVIGLLLQPFLPTAAQKILDCLKVKSYQINQSMAQILEPGALLGKLETLFPRIQ